MFPGRCNLKARRKKEWFDNEGFWRETYQYMFPENRFKEAFDEVDKIVALAAPTGKKVLDLCCGPGRHSIALAKRRFQVTGIDKTNFLMNKARSHARAAKVKIEWVKSDMRDFVRPEGFDLVVNLFTSFGFFSTEEEHRALLRNILASLRPGGVCVIDTIGKERIAKIFQASNVDFDSDGSILVQRRECVGDWTRMKNEWIVIRKGRAKSFHFEHTIYSGRELKDLMLAAGFANVKLYGNFAGAKYDQKAIRLIAVARKAK